jgi:hypothetical protein
VDRRWPAQQRQRGALHRRQGAAEVKGSARGGRREGGPGACLEILETPGSS